jgi:hypothetical protein
MTADITTGRTVRLHPLTYVDEGDAVMVGRPDTGSYGVFPPEGAELLQALETGTTLEAGARRWHQQTGETLDLDDFVGVITDLEFVLAENELRVERPSVRWRRLARAVFSPFAWIVYATLIGAGLVAMVIDPSVRPHYENIFFTSHLAVITVVLALAQFPLLLLHETFHALAARRLNLPSTIGIGRRFYYLVAETRMNSLYSVPRAQRYLPFLAGALIDAVGVGAFTLLCAAGQHWGAPPWLSGLALALAFSGIVRILWECLFYLETDFYFAISTAAGCTDLHAAARYRVRSWLRAATRRPVRPAPEVWAAPDLKAARWYAPLMVGGYGLSLGLLVVVGVPTAVRFWTTAIHRLDGSQPQTLWSVADTLFFVALSLTELGLLGYVTLRDLRRRRRERTSFWTERNAS